jgi:hypothetical protein
LSTCSHLQSFCELGNRLSLLAVRAMFIVRVALPFDISSEMWVMKKFFKKDSTKAIIAAYPKLTYDSAAAIYLFTCESPLYKELNRKLRERNRAALKDGFFPYARLLFEGHQAMTQATPRMLNRGVKLDLVSANPGCYDEGETVRPSARVVVPVLASHGVGGPLCSSRGGRSRRRRRRFRHSPIPCSSVATATAPSSRSSRNMALTSVGSRRFHRRPKCCCRQACSSR